jgi:hypothetical protein
MTSARAAIAISFAIYTFRKAGGTGLITITVRIITVDKTIAIIINTAGAAGFG